MPTKLPLEVAVFSGTSALTAQLLGAHRVELNAPGSYTAGGLTPPVSELTSIASRLTIPVRIMIRPAGPPVETDGHDFMYTPEQLDAMKQSIADFKATGVMNPIRGDGFVFGILKPTPDHDRQKDPAAQVAVDVELCSALVHLAFPYPCVFHRAFDSIAATDRLQHGLRDLTACGFDGVLTSGGPGSHAANLDCLDHMACRLRGGNLQLVVGGGVRAANVGEVVGRLGNHKYGAVWVHSACLTSRPGMPEEAVDRDELCALVEELELAEAGPD